MLWQRLTPLARAFLLSPPHQQHTRLRYMMDTTHRQLTNAGDVLSYLIRRTALNQAEAP